MARATFRLGRAAHRGASVEGTVSGGLGARISLGPYGFVAPEFRLGWEPERRIAVTIGTRIR
jgi:hypothetical protein